VIGVKEKIADGAPSGPNADQIEYWNELAGPKWVAAETLLDVQIGSLGVRAMEHAGVAPGEAVLDVGCGCGQSTLQLADKVGPGGSVTGIDVSRVMLERARSRAAGRDNVRFEAADAQTAALPKAGFDLVFSRFGVMFFADPVAAFANLRSSLKPGGRVAFVCWQELGRNAWMRIPLAAAAAHVSLPAPPAPGAPGPFAFADADRVRRILTGAGFANTACEGVEQALLVGGGGEVERTVEFMLQIGPLGALMRETGEATRSAVAGAVHDAVAGYATPEGVRMDSAAWFVTGVA
jgi:SAM-dependent methyltransferase